MTGGIWAGLVRRRESATVLRRHRKTGLWDTELLYHKRDSNDARTQETTPPARAFDRVESLHDELVELEQRKRQQLAIPPSRTEHRMRLSTIFIFILMLLLAGACFLGGYLFHVMNAPVSLPPLSQTTDFTRWSGAPEAAQTQQGVITEQNPEGFRYLERRAILKQNSEETADASSRTISRGRYAAEQEAQSILANTTQRLTSTVRSILGQHLGNIFAPVAQEVIQGTLGRMIPRDKPLGTGAQTGLTGTGSGGGLTQSQSVATEALQTVHTAQNSSMQQSPMRMTERNSGGVTAPAATQPAAPLQTSVSATVLPTALFAVEVGSFVDPSEAYLYLKNLQGAGYNNAYVSKMLSGNTLMFHVRVGNFQSYTDATRLRQTLTQPARIVMVQE